MEEQLNNIGKRMPYTVPEGFFEEMHERLMDKTVGSPSSNVSYRLSADNTRRRFWMSAAAVVLLIAGVSFYALHRMGNTEASLLADQSESVESYMTDEDLDEWIAIYEGVDNTMMEFDDIMLDTDNTIYNI